MSDIPQIWTLNAGGCQANKSDEDFQGHPTPRMKRGKEKINHSASPIKKTVRSSVAKIVQKSPGKSPIQRQGPGSPQARSHPARKKATQNAHVAKKAYTWQPTEWKKTNATTSVPSSSRTYESTISWEEFETFKQSVSTKFRTYTSTLIFFQ